MKPWTTQFVTCLWASGGFDGIAELHNRELGKQLKGQMNNDSEEAEQPWIAHADRDGKRFVVRADEKLAAFVELESEIRGRSLSF